MKYIKIFENMFSLKTKKYILYITNRTDIKYLYIAENIDDCKFTRIYECVDNAIKKLEDDNEYASVNLYLDDSKNIVYQSDNLEDCLNRLKIMIATDKYNL